MTDSRMEEKVSQIQQDIVEIKVDLKHHIKRTDMLESKVESIWSKALLALAILGALINVLKPILIGS